MATYIRSVDGKVIVEIEPGSPATMLPNISDQGLQAQIDALRTEIRTYRGQPVVVTDSADMDDELTIYLYMGSEEGFNADHWYYYDGTEWVDGGEYVANPVLIDDTLTQSGEAADAKVTGDEISAIKADLTDVMYGYYPVVFNATQNAYINENDGKLVSYNGWMATDYINCDGLSNLYIYTPKTSIYGAFYSAKNEDNYISRLTVVVGDNTIKVPQNAKYCRLSNTNSGLQETILQSKEMTKIIELSTETNVIKSELQDVFIKTGATAVSGKYSDTSGEIKNNSDYAYIVIPYRSGDIDIQGTELSGIINYFSSSDVLLQTSGWISPLNGLIPSTSIPLNTAYIIVSFHVENISTINIYGNKLAEITANSQEIEVIKNIADGVAIKVENSRHIPSNNGSALTLLHFSDLHADTDAIVRIMTDADRLNYDNAICTGDMVANTYTQIASWWNPSVMTCIGNHDTASYSGGSYNWTALSMADRDAYYIAPFESNWDITHTSGTSYYYKDYITQKVRLIVMDVMLYNDNGAEALAQTAWLENLLADANTNDLHVLIAIHTAHGGATAEECSFSRYNQGAMPTYSDCNTPQTVIDAVASAITDGLKFIGYICGHTHQDNIWDAENDGKQLMYCVTCANVDNSNQWSSSDQYRGIDADAYNVITIDTANTLVKIVRGGGADIDDHMRIRKAICFNYSTGEKVGEVL